MCALGLYLSTPLSIVCPQTQPRSKVPLTVQYYLDHVMKVCAVSSPGLLASSKVLLAVQVPPPKSATATSAHKDTSLSLAEQYTMRQGIKMLVRPAQWTHLLYQRAMLYNCCSACPTGRRKTSSTATSRKLRADIGGPLRAAFYAESCGDFENRERPDGRSAVHGCALSVSSAEARAILIPVFGLCGCHRLLLNA